MPKESISTLRDELKSLVGNNAAYQQFLQAIAEAEAKLTAMHTQDEYGRLPRLTKADRDQLMQLHRQIGQSAEGVYGSNASPEVTNLVKKITALAAGNHRALLTYDPEKGSRTLPAILSDVRTLTIDTRGAALKSKLGDQMNTRQPLTFLDDRGSEITGVFTPKVQKDNYGILKSGLNKLAAGIKNPQYREAVKNLPERLRQKAESLGLPADMNNLQLLYALGQPTLDDPVDPSEIDPKKVGRLMGVLYPEIFPAGTDPAKKLGSKVMNGMCDLIFDGFKAGLTYSQAQIPDGSRMDSRNAAMSAVADLLHCSNVIARSRPMNLIGPDGSVVEGTFMAEAKGYDIRNLPPEAAEIGSASLKKKTREEAPTINKAIKSIADLQVLDFLCGNVDRHQGNMLYEFDPVSKKLIKVQGIDNDLALGRLVPQGEQNVKELIAPANMKIVTESMYNTVMALTPEELRFSLRGFGLSEEELQAAGERLTTLKEALQRGMDAHSEMDKAIREHRLGSSPYAECYKPGKQVQLIPGEIRVVKDSDLNRISMLDLSKFDQVIEDGKPTRSPANLFANVEQAVTQMGDTCREQYEQEKRSYQSLRSATAIGAGRRDLPENMATEAEKARLLDRLVRERTEEGRSSPQYDAMQKAVEKYRKFHDDLARRLEDAGLNPDEVDAPIDGIISSGDLIEMQNLARNVKTTANAYLEHKGGGLHFGYTAKRVEIAKMAKAIGEQNSVIQPEEFDAAERSEARALEEVNLRVGNKLEESGWTKKDGWAEGKQNPFRPADEQEAAPEQGQPDGLAASLG